MNTLETPALVEPPVDRSADAVMDIRRLAALPANRLSASRSFIDRIVRERWRIELSALDVDATATGRAVYRIDTGYGVLSFVAFCTEPSLVNRTPRIIGSSWDMLGTIMEGEATPERIEQSARELPKLYAGRAPSGTLMWFRSNQSLRLFTHVRERLAAGEQPEQEAIDSVGYLMRNTGLDGNGTFGTRTFRGYGPGHPLSQPYHAQMLAAYLMREFAVDLVEELARLDAPSTAVRLDPERKRRLSVGNGSALGLVLFALNRPRLLGTWIGAFEKARRAAFDLELELDDPRLALLAELLDRTISYRESDRMRYEVFPGGPAVATDLRRVRTALRSVRSGTPGRSTVLRRVHHAVSGRIGHDAEEIFHALAIELVPEVCDALLPGLVVDETVHADPTETVRDLRDLVEGPYRWALEMPLNDSEFRNRVWYKSRASEEPRSGPVDEVPEGSFDLSIDVPGLTRTLHSVLAEYHDGTAVGRILFDHPELETIVARLQTFRAEPFAFPRVDVMDEDFVPVHLIHVLNVFCFGLDRTEDFLKRGLRGLIFEGAPYREELATADPRSWWWSNQNSALTTQAGAS